jgi:hypothetical protein
VSPPFTYPVYQLTERRPPVRPSLGWCIVGRDSPFKKGEVEIGACPAWCFVKPVKGLRAERPVRSTSLGVTINLDAGPGYSSRDDIISWSNF